MNVPPPDAALFLLWLYAIASAFLVVSLLNLANFNSLSLATRVASVAWPALLALSVVILMREEGGVRQYLVSRLGYLSRRHFVQADIIRERPPKIRFGYELFGRSFYGLEVEGDAVVSVEWGSGQATAMAGRDMNDWHVVLWYRHPDGPRRPHDPGLRDEEVVLVGSSGPKDKTAMLGQNVVAFLQGAGIQISATDDPTKFKVSSPSAA